MVRLFALTLGTQDRLRASWSSRDRRSGPQRVLFLRPDRIGDMIVSTGVIREIAAASDVELDVLASPANAPVLAREARVREVLVLDRTRWSDVWQTVRRMRARQYDVIVDCMPTAPSVTTLMLMLASGARRRVGTSGRGIDDILSPATPSLPLEAHIVDHLALFIPPFRGQDAIIDPRPVIVLSDEERDRAAALWNAPDGRTRLLVNISAGKRARLWPVESYAEVIAAAQTVVSSLELCIISAPHERARGEALAALTGGRYVSTATLREAMAFVSLAQVFFTPDTSLAHAAAAFRVPTVDMLLHGKASQWGLYHAPGINLESPDDSLLSLDVHLAGNALQRVLVETVKAETVMAEAPQPAIPVQESRAVAGVM